MTNLRELLESRAERTPDKNFLYTDPDHKRYSYRRFDQLVNQTANLLHGLGVCEGSVVSLLLSNRVEYLFFYFACWKLGAIAGPVNAHLKGEEIAYVLNHSEAAVLVTEHSFRSTVKSLESSLEVLKSVVLVDGPDDGAIDYQAELERELPTVSPTRLSPDHDAIIIYTSGTTGRPKGCLLTHRNLIANARQISHWLHFGPDDRFLCIMPLFHMNAVAVTTLTPLFVGASIVLPPKFSVTHHWRLVSDYGVTTFGSVATMLTMLLTAYPDGLPDGLDTSRLTFAMCGSAPVPVPVMREFEEKFHCPVVEGYGLSESTCRASFNPVTDGRKLGSVGLPIGNEMKIFDDDDNELTPGHIGEVVLRGENIMRGYFKNPEATAEAFRSGWFHTGDIGYQDEEGYFYIIDRKSDMIIRGGENIYPREIDDVLYRHPDVSEAAAVGVPDPLYGEQVKAYAMLKEGVQCTEEELIAYCRLHLADYKCPTTIEFVTEIPKGPTGKLLKRELQKKKR